MVQAGLESDPRAYSNPEAIENTPTGGVTRRGFIAAGIAAAAAAAAGIGGKLISTRGSEESLDLHTQETVLSVGEDHDLSPARLEAYTAISTLEQNPNLFPVLETDPHILVDKKRQEIEELGYMRFTDENEDDVSAIAESQRSVAELFLRAGHTKPDILGAIENNIKLGVPNENGRQDLFASVEFADSVNENKGKPLLEGMTSKVLDDNIKENAPIEYKLLELQHLLAKQFATGATREQDSMFGAPNLDNTVDLSIDNIQELSTLEPNTKRIQTDFMMTRVEGNSASISLVATYAKHPTAKRYIADFEDYTLEWI